MADAIDKIRANVEKFTREGLSFYITEKVKVEYMRGAVIAQELTKYALNSCYEKM